MKRKPASSITDRAKRYRANRSIEAAGRAKERCAYCGNPEAGDVEHVNGDEADDRPANLVHACRPCNVSKGVTFAQAGLGVRTNQMNPSAGAQNLASYLTAVMVLRGQSNAMSLPAAIKLVHNTPASDRSLFAKQIWDRRRARDTDRVPF